MLYDYDLMFCCVPQLIMIRMIFIFICTILIILLIVIIVSFNAFSVSIWLRVNALTDFFVARSGPSEAAKNHFNPQVVSVEDELFT